MALSKQQLQHMDQVSGLGEADIKKMDQVVGSTAQQPQTPEDKFTGVPKTLLNVSQGAGGLANSLGLGAGVDYMANSGPMQAVQHLTGVNPVENSQLMQEKAQNPAMAIGGDIAGAATTLGGGELLGLAGKGIGAAAKYGTVGKLQKLYDVAHTNSAKLGLTKNWGDIETKANELLQQGSNRFSPELQKEVQSILAKKTPAPTVEGAHPGVGVSPYKKITEFTSKDLHDLRKALDKSIPKTAWGQNVNIRPVGVQANQLVRGIVSNALHEIAPEIKTIDKYYKTYSHPFFQKGPHIPLTNVDIPLPKSMQGLPAGAINAALLTALGTEVKSSLHL